MKLHPVLTTCLAYGAYFAAVGAYQPYFPIWLDHRGMDAGQIALILSVPMILRIFVAPMVGRLADRLGNSARLMRLLLLAALCAAIWLSQLTNFPMILPLVGVMLVALQAVQPLLEANALSLVHRRIAADYGRIRLWGSVTFIALSLIGGLAVSHGGPDITLFMFMGATAVLILVTFLLPQPTDGRPLASPKATSSSQSGVLFGVLAAAALVQASHMAFNVFGSILLRQRGYGETTIGALWAIAAVAEIGMFWAGPLIARRLTPVRVLMAAASFAVLRWSLFPLDLGLGFLILLQLLHALTFSATYLGLMRFIATDVSPSRAASIQGTYMTMQAICSAGATLLAGAVFRNSGAWAFAVSVTFAGVALTLLLLINTRSPGSPGDTLSTEG